MAAAIIMMFVTNLRQSNLFPTSKTAFDPTRQLVWRDVVWRQTYIKVQIKWGKAQQKTSTRFQKIPRARNQVICLARALLAIRPSPCRMSAPIFAFQDGSPIPISFVAKRWRAALEDLGFQQVGFTLHSLRRGGARYLQDMGVNDASIALHAGWKSKAIYDYIRSPGHHQAFSALKNMR